jgi:hypothetical protein
MMLPTSHGRLATGSGAAASGEIHAMRDLLWTRLPTHLHHFRAAPQPQAGCFCARRSGRPHDETARSPSGCLRLVAEISRPLLDFRLLNIPPAQPFLKQADRPESGSHVQAGCGCRSRRFPIRSRAATSGTIVASFSGLLVAAEHGAPGRRC